MFNSEKVIRSADRELERAGMGWPTLWAACFLAAVVVLWLALMTSSHAVAWDELEFFQATTWVRHGKVPYRDFWEHHFPLQWLIMAIPSGWARSNGIDAILAMRWFQAPFWAGSMVALYHWLKQVVDAPWIRLATLGLLFSCLLFTPTAVEYRQDTFSTCFFLWAILALDRPGATWQAKILGGVCLGLAVLANVRMGPVAVLAGCLQWVMDDRGWRWNPKGFGVLAGGVGSALLFLAGLAATHSLGAFWRQCVTETKLVGLLGSFGSSLPGVLLLPIRWPDLAALLFGCFAVWGSWKAIWQLKTAGASQRSLILILVLLVQLVRLPATYIYHLQIIMVLACPLVALALDGWRQQWSSAQVGRLVGLFTLLALVNGLVIYDISGNRATLRYQDRIMTEVNTAATPGGPVWDACAFAFRRRPAFYRWFIPAHIREGIAKGYLPAFAPAQMVQDPPAAVVLSSRSFSYLVEHPDLLRHVVSHYLPVERNLWLPGLSGVVGGGSPVRTWTVPSSGRFCIYAYPAFLGHPWFRDPLACAFIGGAGARQFQIPLDRWPPRSDSAIRWIRNGGVVKPDGARLSLVRGDVLQASCATSMPEGVFLVPEGCRMLFRMPDSPDTRLDADLVPTGRLDFQNWLGN